MRRLLFGVMLLVATANTTFAADEETYLLTPELAAGDTTSVKVTLEVGGEMLLTQEKVEKKFPLSVKGELAYLEKLINWSTDANDTARAAREYRTAKAKVQVEKGGLLRELPAEKRLVIAELREGQSQLACADEPLTRDQFDLLNVVGNSLALNRLLPGTKLGIEGSWQHDGQAIGALLGMDNVAVCEVSSTITGCEKRQVQIRMAGTVHGTVDGAPTEMELRAAYLFNLAKKRITKFNMAIKENRNASQVVPGLDVVAKVSVTVSAAKPSQMSEQLQATAEATESLPNELSYEAPQRGYQFLHDSAWYVIAEQSDRVSLRSLQNGNQTAHCSLSTLPERSKGRETTLEEFESEVRESLGEHLKTVTASTNWQTEQGHTCLGVVAQGENEGIPIEWRCYLIASPGLPRVSLSFTIEQAQLDQFNDADRQIVNSMELMQPVTSTAKKSSKRRSR